jgi:hypothetical protein
MLACAGGARAGTGWLAVRPVCVCSHIWPHPALQASRAACRWAPTASSSRAGGMLCAACAVSARITAPRLGPLPQLSRVEGSLIMRMTLAAGRDRAWLRVGWADRCSRWPRVVTHHQQHSMRCPPAYRTMPHARHFQAVQSSLVHTHHMHACSNADSRRHTAAVGGRGDAGVPSRAAGARSHDRHLQGLVHTAAPRL